MYPERESGLIVKANDTTFTGYLYLIFKDQNLLKLTELSSEQLMEHTGKYAAGIMQAFEDICGLHFSPPSAMHLNQDDIIESGVTIFTYFTGTIQGIYSLNIPLSVAQRILAISDEESDIEDIASGLFEEIVNIATAGSIEVLKKQFGFLTFNPPVVINGDLRFPRYRNCYTTISSESGDATIRFAINMASLDITDKLLKTMKQLRKQQSKNFMDSLTHVYNRAYFDYYKENLFGKSRPLSLVIFDVDKFKEINDSFGHTVGDKALCYIAEVLRQNVRESDYPIRFGGDEFVVLLEHTVCEGAMKLMNRVRNRLLAKPLKPDSDKEITITITISAGITEYIEGEDFQTMFVRADNNLYHAKKSGRNQICTS